MERALWTLTIVSAMSLGYWIGRNQIAMSALSKGSAANSTATGEVAFHFPTADKDAQRDYMRKGFSDILMTERQAYSQCYQDYLARIDPDDEEATNAIPEEGMLTFVFHLAENGALNDHKLIINDFEDETFSQCLSQYFASMHFRPPPLGINRYLAYDFVFKKQETYKKELEERKKNRMPQVLPATPDNVPSSEN